MRAPERNSQPRGAARWPQKIIVRGARSGYRRAATRSLSEPGLLSMAGAAATNPCAIEPGPAMKLLRPVRGMLLAAALVFGAPMLAHAQSAQSANADTPIAWNALSPQQQAQLAPLRDQWDQLPAKRQQQLSSNAQRWAALPPDRQQDIH